jgi:hypothetical protein
MLTWYFGTPNIFITLWFGLDYETNPPLGTLMYNKFIFVCAFGSVMFLQENMDIKDIVTKSSKEQLRSLVRVQVQGKITSKGGKDRCAMTDHPRGLRRKIRTSYEKNPYLDRRNDDLKMTQMKGAKCKM